MGLALALLPVMVLASFDFGVTWDEKSRHRYGEFVWEFYSGLRPRSEFRETGGHLYGGLFDILAVAAEHVLPGNRYVLRHVLDALFGWVGIVYCGRLAGRLFGGWAGVLGMVLLASSPRYFADSMNNPKDLPFAALSIVALYYISTVSPRWPYVSTGTAIKIIIPLALALNIRAGALLYAGYFGLLLGLFILAERNFDVKRLATLTLRVLAIVAAVLLLGTTFWPWAQARPFTRPILALIGLSDFDYGGLVLFNGVEYQAGRQPWTYVPWWFLISTPPVVLLGAALSLWPQPSQARVPRALLWFVFLLPVAMVVLRDSTLYDGIRHLLFTYPILVAIAASGWWCWLSMPQRPWLRRGAAALLVAGLADVLAFNVRAYPNQAVYFNQLVGGPRGAFLRYDMDYWGNCLLEAVTWSRDVAEVARMPVAVSGNPWQLVQLDAERYPQLYFTAPQEQRHHLTVRLNRGPIEGMTELVNRTDALYRVTTPDGTVLCAVFPGPAFEQLRPKFSAPVR